MRIICSFLASLSLASALFAQKEADAIVEPSTKVPRGKLLEWKSAQGRPYWYRIPKDIDPKDPPNLLLMLHGTGTGHGWSFWNYPILGDFRRRDIVVSPDGVTPGQGDTFNFVQGSKDGEQLAGLIGDFKKRFPIGRVYLYGHSQGAFFCYWFAGEYPELIDGIVAHAGNVLDVKHSKLAKQKVAIAILHGRADAVVSVDCAIRTEKIYREQGYEKLKLEIVDGLTEQSGHWPLPQQVQKLLAWLDQVSTQSAAQAVRTAASELQRDAPNLAVVAEQVAKARKLLGKAADEDKKVLPPQLDALGAFLDKAMLVHSQALLTDAAVLDPKASYGPWAEQFLLLDRAFADNPEWKKQFAKPRELQARHEKLVEKALKGLDKSTKETRAAANKCYEEAFLAGNAADLRNRLIQASKDTKDGVAADTSALDTLAATRAAERTKAVKAASERLAPLLQELRTAHPELFPSADGGDAGK